MSQPNEGLRKGLANDLVDIAGTRVRHAVNV